MIVDFVRNIKTKPMFLIEIILPMLEESGLVGKDVVKTIRFYGETFVKHPSFAGYVDSTADYIESLSKSQFGKFKTFKIASHKKEIKLMEFFAAF